ncbi:YveK family protein [Brevibacillus sp. B_LB10_24]|uniref:YveK family protein n=1 Tax=Brevibacillus sp. B_LB10_24 TaxID=3380645 RepID=UPI0038B6CC0C
MSAELEIAEIRRIIGRRLRLIVCIVAIAVLGAGMVSFFVLTPVYEATATLLVKKQNSGTPIGYDDLITSEKLVKTFSQIIQSRGVLEEVIARQQLPLTAEQLQKLLRVKADNESLITSITVRQQDPAKAVEIVNELVVASMQKWNAVMEMDNVSILDEAKLEEAPIPVSPRPYLNMLLSFVISALVGVGLSILIEYLDKTLKTEEEVEETLALPVLGIIPDIKG